MSKVEGLPMTDITKQKLVFIYCTIIGIGLLVVQWLVTDSIMGFFLILFIVCLAMLRWRIPKTSWTTVLDVLLCIIIAPITAGIALFAAMYYGMYFTLLAVVYIFFTVDIHTAALALLGGAIGFLLRMWERERKQRLEGRDTDAERYYELESLQADLMSATAQVERMTAISERARISREIHDNAGHEIVAALISLQTARSLFDGIDDDVLELYDTALSRLDSGMSKIRESVHNLSSITTLGVETLKENCGRFPKDIEFTSFGDTGHVPIHVWNVLESCLNEALTNIAKHALPTLIKVELDATPHIVRLYIENDGAPAGKRGIGTGLRNLRHRLVAVGGNLGITPGETFRLVCVVPIKKELL